MLGTSRLRSRRLTAVAVLATALVAGPAIAARASTGGAVDPFGDGGQVTVDLDNGLDIPGAAYARPDGGVVVVTSGTGADDRPVVRAVLADGRPDPTLEATLPVVGRARSLAPGLLGTIVVGVAAPDVVSIVRLLPGGRPDPLFGADGVVRFEGDDSESMVGLDVDRAGRVTVATDRGGDVVVRRLLPTGTLDPTFGDGGVRPLPFAEGCTGTAKDAHAVGLVVQPDGGVVVGGGIERRDGSCQAGHFVVRLFPDGSADTTWTDAVAPAVQRRAPIVGLAVHGDGVVVLNRLGEVRRFDADGTVAWTFTGPGGAIDLHAIAVDGDRTYLAGATGAYGYCCSDATHLALVGLDADGQVLPAYRAVKPGGDRVRAVDSVALRDEIALGLAVRPGLGPVLVGLAADQLLLAATDGDGNLLPGFGAGGRTLTGAHEGADDLLTDLVLDGEGRTLVAGTTSEEFVPGRADPAILLQSEASGTVVRLRSDGTLDPSFADGGRYQFVEAEHDVSIAPLPSGALVVAGTVSPSFPRTGESYDGTVLRRLDADGEPDPSFGVGGLVRLPGSMLNATSDGLEVVLGPGGTILVLALGWNDDDHELGVLRLTADGSVDPTFNEGTSLSLGLDAISAVAVLPDGSTSVIGGRPDGQRSRSAAVELVRVSTDGRLTSRVVLDDTPRSGLQDPPRLSAFAIRADGAIVGTGMRRLVRFDRHGVVLAAITDDRIDGAHGVLLVDDGSVMTVRGNEVRRYGPDLRPDAGFGVDGIAPVPAPALLDVGSSRLVAGPGAGVVTAAASTAPPFHVALDSDVVVGRVDLTDPTGFPEITIADATTVTVDEDEAVALRFPVHLSRPSIQEVEVRFDHRRSGPTTGGGGTFTIPPGVTDLEYVYRPTFTPAPGTYDVDIRILQATVEGGHVQHLRAARVVEELATGTMVVRSSTTPPIPTTTSPTTAPPVPPTTATPTTPPPTAPPSGPGRVQRLAGDDRIATAVAISADGFPGNDGASAAVLARADDAADALAGTPLAVRAGGPLLVTGRAALDPRVAAELQRVLAPGATVYLLGGDGALSPAVAVAVSLLGFRPVRLAGPDRFATSVAIAATNPSPSTILLTTGRSSADALSAGAAAGHVNGVVVLTDGFTLPGSVAGYLAQHPSVPTVAVGGPATFAAPTATPIAGADRYWTSAMVAGAFFPQSDAASFANGETGVDALAGGVHAARLGGPLLLVEPDFLSAPAAQWVDGHEIVVGSIYGGTVAVSGGVESELRSKIL